MTKEEQELYRAELLRNREERIERVTRGDHSLCADAHDLLGTCPVELGIAVLEARGLDPVTMETIH